MTGLLLFRADLLSAGYTDTEIRTQLKRGSLRRLSAGAYVLSRTYEALEPDEQVRMRVVASAAGVPGLVISHSSAAAMHRLPVLNQGDGVVHFTRVGRGGSRTSRGRQVHTADLAPDQVTQIEGVAVTAVAQTVSDLGRTLPARAAVVTADAALNRRLATRAGILDSVDRARFRPGHPAAHRMLGLVDGRSESPGETVTRLILRERGVRDLELQIEIRDEADRFVARADLGCLAAGVLIEFDGKIKYGRLLKPGQTIEEVILAEREREKRLTELGWLVIRVIWSELSDPVRLADRVRRACDAHRRLVVAIRGSAVPAPLL